MILRFIKTLVWGKFIVNMMYTTLKYTYLNVGTIVLLMTIKLKTMEIFLKCKIPNSCFQIIFLITEKNKVFFTILASAECSNLNIKIFFFSKNSVVVNSKYEGYRPLNIHSGGSIMEFQISTNRQGLLGQYKTLRNLKGVLIINI